MAELHVLVALDGSDFSRTALNAVRTIFEPPRARLTLLRVGSLPPHVGGPPPRPAIASEWTPPDDHPDATVWDSQEWESARQRLRDSLDSDARHLKRDGWRVEVATAFGEPAEEIVAWCERERPDLVAMASHGRSGLSRALVGSVTERALRRLNLPVLVTRPEAVREAAANAASREVT